MNKVGIIGCGNVGLAIIHEICTLNLEWDIILVDCNENKMVSNILDFNHMLSLTNVKMGDYRDLSDCDVLIITSGIKNDVNRTRFLKNSYVMIDNIMRNLLKVNYTGNIIVISNPNDVLTTYVSKMYKYPCKVIGTGTMIDTNRLKYLLSKKYMINTSFIDAMIIGEHGNTQKIVWDSVKLNNQVVNLSKEEKDIILDKVINAANEVVKGKGYTNYAIASIVCNLLIKMFAKESFKLVASFYNEKVNVAYSMPLVYENKVFKYDNNYNYLNEPGSYINKIKREYFIFQNEIIIGIDLDDTITDIQSEMKYYAAIFDKENNGKGIIDNSKYLVGEMYNWNNEMKDKFFLTYRKQIVMNAKVRKNVIKIFNKWQSLGYKIFIITARSEKYYDNPYSDTYRWLRKHHIPFDELVVETGDKKDICKKLNVNYFVDDMPNNCMLVNSISDIKVFIMDNGNNICEDKRIIRIHNFEEMDKEIENV